MVNSSFELIQYGGDFNYYLFELANFCAVSIFLFILYKLRFINSNSLIVWTGLFFTPLIFNYLIFTPLLFPDQFQYAGELMSLKSKGVSLPNIAFQGKDLSFSLIPGTINQVTLSSTILGLIPIPNYMTVTSMAFSNKIVLFLSFLWLKKYFHNENILLLYFLIPSLVLYSSLSLRDTLIITSSILFLINIMNDRFLISLIFLYLLLHIKIQMFAFFSIYYIGRLVFKAHKSFVGLSIYGFVILAIVMIFDDFVITILNTYRWGFAAENFDIGSGMRGYAAWGIYGDQIRDSLELSSIQEAVYASVAGLPKLILMPLPWNWTNIFYPIQAIESIVLVSLFIWLTFKYKLYENKEYFLLLFVLFISLMTYSLLVFNIGTFVRYRFTLFFPFLIAIAYLIERKQVTNSDQD